MNYKMTGIKNNKTATVLMAITALTGLLTIDGHIALAANDDNIYYGIGIGSGIGTTDTATGGNGGNVQGGNGEIAVGPIAIGAGTVSAFGINTGINVPTDTGQKSNCETAGGTSSIGDKTPGSCTDTSTNGIIQSGGILTHGEKHK